MPGETEVSGVLGTTPSSAIHSLCDLGQALSPYLFNLYVEYIMQNAGLDEPQAGIKIEINLSRR